jgi:hypothetical protein
VVIIKMVVAVAVIVTKETKFRELHVICVYTLECELKLPNSNWRSAARTASKPAVCLHDL